MEEMMNCEKINEYIETYALYRIDLIWEGSMTLTLLSQQWYEIQEDSRENDWIEFISECRLCLEWKFLSVTGIIDVWGAEQQLIFSFVVANHCSLGYEWVFLSFCLGRLRAVYSFKLLSLIASSQKDHSLLLCSVLLFSLIQ